MINNCSSYFGGDKEKVESDTYVKCWSYIFYNDGVWLPQRRNKRGL